MSRKIVITVEVSDEASERHTKELAESMLESLEYYDPDEFERDLRAYADGWSYEIKET